MDHTFSMKVFESAEDLREYGKNIFFRNLFAFISVNKVLQTSIAKFHNNHGNFVMFDEINYLSDVRMAQLSQIVDFTKYFFPVNSINFWIKEIFFELFNGVKLLIYLALYFENSALSSFAYLGNRLNIIIDRSLSEFHT
jgi:hypothetical protein